MRYVVLGYEIIEKICCYCDNDRTYLYCYYMDETEQVHNIDLTHSPRLSSAQCSLNSAESWPKTPFIHFI